MSISVDSLVDLGVGLTDAIGSLLLDTPPDKLIDILGVEDDQTLTVKGFGYASILKINGYYGAVGTDEFVASKTAFYNALKNRLTEDSSHMCKFIFESDPDGAREMIDDNYSQTRAYLKSIDLDLDDLLDEKRDANLPFVQKESCYFVFYSYPAKQNEYSVEDTGGAGIGSSELCFEADKLLLNHKAIFESIASVLSGVMNVQPQTADSVIAELYRCINGNAAYKNTTFLYTRRKPDTERQLDRLAHLPNRKLPLDERQIVTYLREVTRDNDKSMEPLLPPTLSEQLIATGCYDPGSGYVVSGSRMYAPLGISVYGRDIKDFDVIVRSMRGTPFRMAMTLKPNGLHKSFFDNMETMFAAIGGLLSKRMRIRNHAWSQLENMRLNESIVSLSMTAATWAPLDKRIDPEKGKSYYATGLLDKRVTKFKTALNDWASMQAKDCVGDGLECLFSTFPGLIGYHVAKTCPAPLSDITNLLPITRVSSAWDSGSLCYRTEDGKPIFVEPMSNKQASEVVVLIGEMGSGKSGQLVANNIGFITKPTASIDLPFLRGIDFGYSQKGLVDAIRDGLPEDEKHRVGYIQYSGDKKNSYNPHDLMLGERAPSLSLRNFLVNLLMAATDSISSFAHHGGLCGSAVDLAYKMYSDAGGNPQAKRYKRDLDYEVDAYIEKYQIPVEEGVTSWYELTDKIFLSGSPRMASRAQRYAVPTLTDYFSIATEQELTQEYPHLHNGVPICKSFKSALSETLKNIPMLSGVSAMDISDSPIFIVDLKDILPSGEQPRQVQATNAIIFLAMMRLLTADFFVDDKSLPRSDSIYFDYHEERIRKIMSANKRLFIDEKHRINGIPAASAGVDGMTFEGRKFGISVVQCSQLLSQISEGVAKLATTVVICGASATDEVEAAKKKYEFTDFHGREILSLKKPGKEGAQFFVRYTTNERRFFLKLINTEGPRHLCMIATNKNDRAIRDGLAKITNSAKVARVIYAKEFPSGSVENEVRLRSQAISEGIYKSPTNDLLKDILYDLSKKYNLIRAS